MAKKSKAPAKQYKQPGVWGIDLGQCALKALRLEMKDGEVTATAFDYIEHPKILSQPDADPDQLSREALESFLKRNDLRGDMVVISVPGQSGLARFVKLPPVEEKKIDAIVTFEAKQQIPFPLEEVVWDYQRIGRGMVSDGFALDTEVGLFAMKRDMVNRALQQFKDVNVEVHVVQMAPLALCNYVAYDLLREDANGAPAEGAEEEKGDKECVVALDIGADNSNLVITDAGKIIWQRPIPLGGNHFTRTLTKEMKLTFAKAEHIKRNAIKSPDLRKILTALRPVLNDFVNEVQRSLGYFTNTHRGATVGYMIGLGNVFRLPGLQKFLQEKLQLDVRKPAKFDRLHGDSVINAPQFTENIMSFAVAYGLALQGLKAARIQTNLLPHEIRNERMVRAKKPWAVAAAAALLLAIGGMTFGRSVQYRTVKNPEVDKAITTFADAEKAINRIKADYQAQIDLEKASKEAVNHIQSTPEDRHNWILVYKYINDCLPLPWGGLRLASDTDTTAYPHKQYWTTEAEAAFKDWVAKRNPVATESVKKIKPAEKQELEKKIQQNLVQLNIESIGSLYFDDLAPYFTGLNDRTKSFVNNAWISDKEKELVTKKIDDNSKLPKKGWVFEIRGYTFHQDQEEFIKNTLIANLRYPEKMVFQYDKDNKPIYYPLSEDIKKRVKEKISFVCLAAWEKVQKPVPGNFKLIHKSFLKDVTSGGGGGDKGGGGFKPPAPGDNKPGSPGPGGPGPGGPGGGGGDDKAKTVSRDGWSPLGEIAPSAFKGSAASGSGPAGLQTRIEFVVLFVWEEPLTDDGAEAGPPGG